MIDTVLFDMGGTLEDIYVDDASKEASAREVLRILSEKGISVSMNIPEAIQELADGWDRYAAYRSPTNRELKPEGRPPACGTSAAQSPAPMARCISCT